MEQTKTLGRKKGKFKRVPDTYMMDADLPSKIEIAKNELRNQRGDKTTKSDIVNDAVRFYFDMKGGNND